MTITAIYHGRGDDDIFCVSNPTSLTYLKLVLPVMEPLVGEEWVFTMQPKGGDYGLKRCHPGWKVTLKECGSVYPWAERINVFHKEEKTAVESAAGYRRSGRCQEPEAWPWQWLRHPKRLCSGPSLGQGDSAGKSEGHRKYALGGHHRIQQRLRPRGSWEIPA